MNSRDTKGDYSIVIVDNRPMYRAGIKANIRCLAPQSTFYEYGLWNELLSKLGDKNPELFLIRAGNIPDKILIDNIKKLRSLQRSCTIILYDYQQPLRNILYFFRGKINAYLADNFDENDLRDCINSLRADRAYVSMQIAIELLIAPPEIHSRNNFKLTPTEARVADLLIKGRRPSQIARDMNRKASTISTIKSNIFKKINVNNINDLIVAMGNTSNN